jgi:hypothetical protein
MIDTFALLVSHGLMLIAAWRMLARRDLDKEGDPHAPVRKRPDDTRRHRDA